MRRHYDCPFADEHHCMKLDKISDPLSEIKLNIYFAGDVDRGQSDCLALAKFAGGSSAVSDGDNGAYFSIEGTVQPFRLAARVPVA